MSRTCVAIQGRDVSVSASVGFTSLDEHTAGERAALAAADRAMYEIKNGAGRAGPPADHCHPRAARNPQTWTPPTL